MIQSRSPSGSPSRPTPAREARAAGRSRSRRRSRAALRGGRNPLQRPGRGPSRSGAGAQRVVLGEPCHGRRSELGLLGEAGRIGDRAAARLRLEQEARAPAGSRHEDGCLGERGPARIGLHERSRARPVADRSRDRRATGQGRRAREHDLPAGQRRQQAEHGPGARRSGPGASSTTISFRFVVGREDRSSRPRAGSSRSRPGTVPTARSIASSEVPSSASTRARSFARWFLRGGTRDALGGEERRSRGRLGLEQRRRGEARQPGLEAVHDVEGADRERWPRGWRGRPSAARPARSATSGTAAPIATTSPMTPRCSARRPSSRSAARDDGATTVTMWPRRRSASAAPRTCSLTSCGCDHENGVTKQMRRPIGADDSSHGPSLARVGP